MNGGGAVGPTAASGVPEGTAIAAVGGVVPGGVPGGAPAEATGLAPVMAVGAPGDTEGPGGVGVSAITLGGPGGTFIAVPGVMQSDARADGLAAGAGGMPDARPAGTAADAPPTATAAVQPAAGAGQATDPAEAFIAAHTALARPALVPEVELYLATEITPIWQATEEWLAERNIEPPFWAFAWPGSQALARLMLDGTVDVRGRRVLDFAAGGGLAAIAALRAGAASVEAAEIDPLARAATRLNARHNGVAVATPEDDVVGAPCRWDTILAGDVCYEAPMTQHIMPWLRRLAAGGAEVLLADPGRAYLPKDGMVALGRFPVPTTRELEDRDSREVTIYRVLG